MVTIDFEGTPVAAFAGEPVAVALFAAGMRTLGRSTKYHRPRGLFCLDGHCASCYMRIDGRPNRRACMVPARDGLRCERQNAFPSADVDLLAAADWLFPRGMDHHTLMTRQPRRQRAVPEDGARDGRLRHAAGRRRAAPPRPPTRSSTSACGRRARRPGAPRARSPRAAAGARVALYDEQDAPGGSLLAEPGGGARARVARRRGARRRRRLASNATAIGFFPGGRGPSGSPGVLAVATDAGLVRVSARRTLYATGAYDQNLPFADNDRPGVIAARALGRLAFRWGIRPVPRRTPGHPRCGGDDRAAGRALEQAGVGVRAVTRRATRSWPRWAASGSGASRWRCARGETRTAAGDLVAVATVPAPASELPRQHGARVALRRRARRLRGRRRRPPRDQRRRACSRAATSPASSGTAAAERARRRRGARARLHAGRRWPSLFA